MQTIAEAHAALIRGLTTAKPDAIRGGRASIPDIEAREDHLREVTNLFTHYLVAMSDDLKDTCPEYKAPNVHGISDAVAESLDDAMFCRMTSAIELIREELEAQGEDPDARHKLRREAA